MKDLKAYKLLQFDYPESKSGGWESNPLCFSAVAFFIQTAPNALLIHASVAVASKFKLIATPWNSVYGMRSHFEVYSLICSVNSNSAVFFLQQT